MAAQVAGSSSLSVPELQRQLAELSAELQARTEEKAAALQREAAIGEVLRAVNGVSGDPRPVFQTMLEKAMALCGASFGGVWIFDGNRYVAAALHGVPEAYAAFLRGITALPGPGSAPDRFLRGERSAIHSIDVSDEELYRSGDPQRQALVELGGARTALHVPLCRDERVVGVLTIYRQEVRAFDDGETALLQTFAAQAVLALENARLLAEAREALEQQTATAEILEIINSSPGDVNPVFDAVLASATRLCDAAFGILWLSDGQHFWAAALHGAPEAYAEIVRVPHRPLATNPLGRLLRGERLIVSVDVAAEEAYRAGDPARLALVDVARARSVVQVALVKDDAFLGSLTVYRREVRPFSEKQINLLQNFAAQAVIAIENTRLLTEQREALERQTATTEVLAVINSSPGRLQPVFDAMLERAVRLSESAFGLMTLHEDGKFNRVALYGVQRELIESEPALSPPGPSNTLSRLRNGEDVVHTVDLATSPAYLEGDRRTRDVVELAGARSLLAVALRKDDAFLGSITAYRQEVRPFTDKQVALLRGFAGQAVIAIENGRLLDELREALERQTATAEVLKVINASPGNLGPVFDALLEKASELCGAKYGTLFLYDGNAFTVVATRNVPAAYEAVVRGQSFSPEKNSVLRHLQEHRRPLNVKDVFDEAYVARDPLRVAAIELAGVRSLLAVPLLKGRELTGFIGIYRDELGGFGENEIALVSAFADQAVIAIENVRLVNETREALEQQTATAEVLQVINSSPGNLAPVFDSMLEKAMRQCDAAFGHLDIYDGSAFRTAAVRGVPAKFAEFRKTNSTTYGPGTGPARMLAGESIVRHVDLMDDDAYRAGEPNRRALVELGGARSSIQVALRKDEEFLGFITLFRKEVRPFTEKQGALLQNFAAQAVIAMENARLLGEQREALEQQTATAEVLQVINSSPGNLGPVFDAMLEKATRLCSVPYGQLALFDGEHFRFVAVHGRAQFQLHQPRDPKPPSWGITWPRIIDGENVVHISDVAASEIYRSGHESARRFVDTGGGRSLLTVALRKDSQLLGALSVYSQKVRPFTDKQIALLQNFAAQAVVAIENARLLSEQREALERQTATAEILQIINGSPGDLEPVFISVLEKALRLCEAAFGVFWTYDGNHFHASALLGVPAAFADFAKQRPHRVGNDNTHARALRGEAVMHIVDAADSEAYRLGDPLRRALVDLGGARTSLGVALRKDEALLGVLILYRKEVRPFSERQISLIESFAGQAVVAMENARLLDQLHQRTDDLARSVDELTATGDVLRAISRSSTDLKAVLDTLLATVARLCRADQTYMFRRHDELHHLVAAHGVPTEGEEFIRNHPFKPGRGTTSGRVALERRIIHIEDVLSDPEYDYREGQNAAGFRSMLGLPLLREDTLVGIFVLGRTRVEPFTAREIELAASFADQAVIAIENARLFEELRESLDQQTASAEILQVISQSPTDVTPVLNAVVAAALRFCGAEDAVLALRVAEHVVVTAHVGTIQARIGTERPLDRSLAMTRAVVDCQTVHVPDMFALDPAEYAPALANARSMGFKAALAAPMVRDGAAIGSILLRKSEAGPFTQRQISLLEVFASQAVIAIENVRLFTRLRDSQAELRVTFDSMGDGVAMFDTDRRLAAWNRNFEQIMGLSAEWLETRPNYAEYLDLLANRGEFGTENVEAELASRLEDTERELRLERTRADGSAIEVRRNAVPGGGFVLIYSDITQRRRAEQAVRQARDVAETALKDLKTAQASLIHAEKMASLGQLTAGIAHEIKNPLNFVNNFAGLSMELLDELKDTVAPTISSLDEDGRALLDDTIALLTSNLEKIRSHGQRADGIVKSMLLHSRGGSSDRQTVDINAVLEEALNLAYHGARAHDPQFNVTLERDLQVGLAPIEIVPQDVTRVFLNLIGNGFYAMSKRWRQDGEGFRPVLKVTSRAVADAVEIVIRDNGTGISAEDRGRLFQPFFTTKPTGEGTGLGLSISYDIVTQQHGGTVTVDSEVGVFTEFAVMLPRRQAAPATSRDG